MKMNYNEFLEGCKIIDAEFEKMTSMTVTVTDGVIDCEKYYNANPRLLWILKEANSDDSWSYINNFKNRDWLLRCNGLSSIRRVIYTSYGILHSSDKTWSEFLWSYEEESQSALQEIGFINIKKQPGGSTSNNNEIAEAYNNNKELLKLQINTYDPDVIIFGNTMNYVDLDDFAGLAQAEKHISPINNHFYYVGDKLYIQAYHPSYMKLSDKDFVMDIVRIYRDWKNRK